MANSKIDSVFVHAIFPSLNFNYLYVFEYIQPFFFLTRISVSVNVIEKN